MFGTKALKEKPFNFFGELFPSHDHNQLIEIFGILPTDKVLDVGGGHNPFSRANYIVDYDLAGGVHRDGHNIPEELVERYIEADIHQLPFEDKSMDFVFCSHVLEHVLDPETACREIIRVGKRGYIETPRKWSEFFAGYPSHRWLIDVIDGGLVFERRKFIESPFLNFALPSVWKSKKLEERALKSFRNISHIQFYWEESFQSRVINSGINDFDYSKPYHAALAHFYFARNILFFDAPPKHGIFHAENTVKLCPYVELFWVLCALYALLSDSAELWSKSHRFLQSKKIISARDVFSVKFGFKKSLINRLMRILEENDPPR